MAKPEYWQFVCNPSNWDIQRKLLSDEIYDDWVISKSHKDFFAVGQLGFIRVVGQGKKTVKKLNKLKRKKIEPGYYALVEVVGIFYGETSYPNFWINPTGNDKDLRVKIKILNNYLKKPLKIEKLKKINFDFDRVVFNPTQGKPNNPLSKNTFDKLYELAGGLRDFKSNKLIFGNIETVKVGQLFNDRDALSKAKVHGPTMAGIWGREKEGACSIVLSGGYEDDIDELDYIFYTGQGGQNVPGGKQVSDQEFVRGNKALMLSCKYNLPVRVTRGFQIKNGPKKGYRYDGLYYVNRYERVKGKSGFYICRFHLSSEKPIETLEKEIKKNLKTNYKRADRASSTVNRIKRDVSLAENIKEIYEYKCQICNVYLKTPSGGIAIGAHIKGLGKPHNGPDVVENMICLCPNHHTQFDYYGFYIEPESFEIKGLTGFEGKKITLNKKHKIENRLLKYHKKEYKKNN